MIQDVNPPPIYPRRPVGHPLLPPSRDVIQDLQIPVVRNQLNLPQQGHH